MDEGVVLGFPYQQLNTESNRFGYGGLSPEEAIQQQRLNRRQQIANLLIQKGLGQPQGQMAGRFYVAPSPWQGAANLATLAAGVYGTKRLGEEEQELLKQHRDMTIEAVKKYEKATTPQPETVQVEGPGIPVQKEWPAPGRPDFTEPETNVPPELAQRRTAWIKDAMERGPLTHQEGPFPTTTVMRQPTEEGRYAALADIMATAPPQAREAVRFLEQLRQQQTERELQRQQAILLKQLEAQNAAALKGIPSADSQAELAVRKELHGAPSGNTLAQIGSQQQLHATPSGNTLAEIQSREQLHKQPSGNALAEIQSREQLHKQPSGNALVQAADQVAVIDPATGKIVPNQAAIDAKRQIAEAGAAKTQVAVNTQLPASEEAQKEFMKGARTTYDQLKMAPQTLANIEKAKALIPSASAFMGPGGQGLLAAAKFFNNRLGMSIDTEGIKSAEELRSRIFFNIMDNLKKMDAQPSQLQQQIMMESLGTLGTDPQALIKILDAYGEVIQDKVSTYNADVSGAERRGVKFPYDPVIRLPSSLPGALQPAGTPVPIPGAAGGLSPAEQKELDTLRKKYGR